ncbi:MAG: adenylate/guanylate cyclase domain-containing protein, partial [Alphaproteobacteria bacterium]
AKDVLAGAIPAERFTRRLVLIGTSASGLLDQRATPVDPVMPGVEVHAQLLESILSGQLLHRPDYAIGAEVLLALVVGLAIVILAPILGARTVFVLGSGIAALVIGGSWYLFSEKRLLLDAAYPMISSFAVFVTMLSVNYFREESRRRQIRGAFGQYLSPDLVKQLADDPDRLVLGGETREMTILFSDVRGFTSISESYKEDPQGLTVLINRLLTPFSNAIMETGGTIDKYMGDNVMAFWNAPLDNPDHARDACATALEMLKRLEALNAERAAEAKAEGKPFLPLDVGIGINTGECVVGNMGSDVRFDYTVLGDAVNLAARLEGQSKTYGVRTIIGEATARRIGDSFATVELDAIRVKGKQEPETIYAILGPGESPHAQACRDIQQAMAELLACYRDQNWAAALKALRAVRGLETPFDLSALCDLYEARIRAFKRSPPPKNWDGVYTAETK